MSAEELLDEIMFQLTTHPDPAFAKRNALKVLEEELGDFHDDCPYCGAELPEACQ